MSVCLKIDSKEFQPITCRYIAENVGLCRKRKECGEADDTMLAAILFDSGLEEAEALALLGELFYAAVDTVNVGHIGLIGMRMQVARMGSRISGLNKLFDTHRTYL